MVPYSKRLTKCRTSTNEFELNKIVYKCRPPQENYNKGATKSVYLTNKSSGKTVKGYRHRKRTQESK